MDSRAGGGEVPEVEDVNENPGQQQRQQEMEQFVSGKFHFVDLAGSERVSKTGNKGERFKGICTGSLGEGGGADFKILFLVLMYVLAIIDILISGKSIV